MIEPIMRVAMTETDPATTPRITPDNAPDATLALLQAAIGVLLVMLDFNAPLTTLSATSGSLGGTAQTQTWMLAGMSLGLASSLLISGALGDAFGRRRVFRTGLVLLVAATLAATQAWDSWSFVAARVVQGAAGGAVIACGLGLIAQAFPSGTERRRATGIWGASLGAGIAIGPLLAAALATYSGWRSVYLLEAVFALILLVGAARLLETPRRALDRIDVPGALIFAGAMALITGGLVEGRQGWDTASAITPLIAGAAGLLGFASLEMTRVHPLIEMRLFRSGGFVAATVGAMVTGVAVIGFMSYLPTVLQKGVGESATVSACALALWSGTSAVVSLLARRLPARMSGSTQLSAGLLVCALGLAALCQMSVSSSWSDLVPGLVLTGMGGGVLNAALARLAIESVPAQRAGMGSGANNTARYLGSSVGVAVVVAVVAGNGMSAGQSASSSLISGMDVSALIAAGVALMGAVVTAVCSAAAHASPRR